MKTKKFQMDYSFMEGLVEGEENFDFVIEFLVIFYSIMLRYSLGYKWFLRKLMYKTIIFVF